MNPLKPTAMTLDEAKSQSILMIGTFYNQVDPTNALSLEIHAGDAFERYQFNCFHVELATIDLAGHYLLKKLLKAGVLSFLFFFFVVEYSV